MNKGKEWLGLIIPALLIIGWLLFGGGGNDSMTYRVLPAPLDLGRVMLDFVFGNYKLNGYSGEMLFHLGTSFFRVIKGFLLAAVLGVIAGCLTGRFALVKVMTDPLIQAVRAVPGIGFLPIAIVWFGVGEKNTLFLITLAAFFPIYLNTQQGIANVPKMYLQAGQMMGASRMSLFGRVIVPAAFPQVFAGLRLGLGISWAYLVLGEMTGVNAGLGAVMMNGRMLGQVDIVIVCMIIIGLAGKLSDFLLTKLCIWCLPGQRQML